MAQERKTLLFEKKQFNDKYCVLREELERVKEDLDGKSAKYGKLKRDMERLREEKEDKELGKERLREEMKTLERAKGDAEQRAKKFET